MILHTALALYSLLSLSQGSHRVDISSLLKDMANSDLLAKLDSVPYKQVQASSYDRKQTDPKDPVTWFANEDYGQFIRTERVGDRTEWVVMDHQGPGAITRIWTPLLGDKDKMIVRFYFDGAKQPAIEENFNDLLRGRGKIAPPFAYVAWPEPNVADGVGGDCYFPIPYAKSCKVTLSEVPFYYAISYRAYAPNTAVKTFTWDDFNRSKPLALITAKTLGEWHPSPLKAVAQSVSNVKPLEVDLPSGAKAVSELTLKVGADIDRQALRSTVIEMTFDGNRSVWCPIGEFFGCGVTLKPLWDRFRYVGADGTLSSRWTMPYQHHAKLRILNLTNRPISVALSYQVKPWTWDDRSMIFHSTWRFQDSLPTMPRSDWNYLEASGKGRYVGDTLTVMNPSANWYGEGDERVYVDGETFPSTLGTGTEDYYGYAWGMDEHWSSAFMSMPLRGRKGRENWTGFTTTSRVRGLDDVPFQSHLKFDMEIWHWANCEENYSAATFWYGMPSTTSNRTPSPGSASEEVAEPTTAGIKGAIECETMDVLGKSSGVQIGTQNAGLVEGAWSGGEQLFVQATAIGQYVDLALPVPKSGRYQVLLYATKSYDYGIWKASFNGVAGSKIDFWGSKPTVLGPVSLGTFEFNTDKATLHLEVIGSNEKSTGSKFYTGLDCVVLKPIL